MHIGWKKALLFTLLMGGWSAHAQEFRIPIESAGQIDVVLPESLRIQLEEKLNGPARWEPITALKEGTVLHLRSRSVGKITFTKKGVPLGCTAFLVDTDKILTNNHCLISELGRAKNIKLIMGYKVFGGRKGVNSYKVKGRALKTSGALDFALLSVEGRPGDIYGVAALASEKKLPSGPVYLVHHPAGKPKKVSRRDCRVVGTGAAGYNRWLHTCDTVGGSSGGALFDSEGVVVGLHFGAGDAESGGRVNLAKPMSEIYKLIKPNLTIRETSPIESQVAVAPAATSGDRMVYFLSSQGRDREVADIHNFIRNPVPRDFLGWVKLGYSDLQKGIWREKFATFPKPDSIDRHSFPSTATTLIDLSVSATLPFELPSELSAYGEFVQAESANNLVYRKGSRIRITEVVFRKLGPGREEVWARVQ